MCEIRIAEYKKDDRDACIKLLKHSFPGNSDEATFKWRFESKMEHDPILICAKANDKVIGFISYLPWEFYYDTQKLLGYQGGELAIDENYRGKGIASKIFNFGNNLVLNKGVDFLFSFPRAKSQSASVHWKCGYIPIGNFYTRLRIINPIIKKNKIEISIDVNFEKYWMNEKNRITPFFTSNYYDWRYIQNPKEYSIIKFSSNNNEAFFILRNRQFKKIYANKSVNFMMLIDCQFTTFNDQFIHDALKYLDSVIADRALFLTTFCNWETDKGKAILKYFRIPVKSRSEMLCLKPNINKSNFTMLYNYKNWELFPHLKDEY